MPTPTYIAAKLGVTLEELRSGDRTPPLTFQRMIFAIYLMRECGYSEDEAAIEVGRDRSTMYHYKKIHDDLLDINDQIFKAIHTEFYRKMEEGDYKGFTIAEEEITEGRRKYRGLVARKGNIRTASPIDNPFDLSGLKKSIDELKLQR